MFSNLVQNSLFYILDKNNKPTLKIGKVSKVTINPQYYGLNSQELDIIVNVNDDTYEFKKIPNSLSIVSPSTGIVISDNIDDITKEAEAMFNNSKQILDSIDYHNAVIESKDEIMSMLNPKFAKEKEQETKLNLLDNRVGNVEKGIDEIKTMLNQVLNK